MQPQRCWSVVGAHGPSESQTYCSAYQIKDLRRSLNTHYSFSDINILSAPYKQSIYVPFCMRTSVSRKSWGWTRSWTTVTWNFRKSSQSVSAPVSWLSGTSWRLLASSSLSWVHMIFKRFVYCHIQNSRWTKALVLDWPPHQAALGSVICTIDYRCEDKEKLGSLEATLKPKNSIIAQKKKKKEQFR